MPIPSACPLAIQANTLRRSCAPGAQRSANTDWAGLPPARPNPKPAIPIRKVAGLSAMISENAATAATPRATIAISAGGQRSANRPPSGAASNAPTENRLDAAAPTMPPQPRVVAA
nr:hypothetical protein [Microlunatus sp. Gsoil 973]